MKIDYPRPDDEAFFYDSWLRSWHDTPLMTDRPKGVFYPWARKKVNYIFDMQPLILTIRDEDKPEWLCSWMVTSVVENRFVLHWAFTKKAFRKRGYSNALLKASLDKAGKVDDLAYTIHSRFDMYLEGLGFTFHDLTYGAGK